MQIQEIFYLSIVLTLTIMSVLYISVGTTTTIIRYRHLKKTNQPFEFNVNIIFGYLILPVVFLLSLGTAFMVS